jgi:hypothetical protein
MLRVKEYDKQYAKRNECGAGREQLGNGARPAGRGKIFTLPLRTAHRFQTYCIPCNFMLRPFFHLTSENQMKRRFRFSFEVNEEQAKVITPLLIDCVGKFVCAEVVPPDEPPPVSNGSAHEEELLLGRNRRSSYYNKGNGKGLADAIIDFLAARAKPVHYSELRPLLVERNRKASSVHAILSDLHFAGMVRRESSGHYSAVPRQLPFPT